MCAFPIMALYIAYMRAPMAHAPASFVRIQLPIPPTAHSVTTVVDGNAAHIKERKRNREKKREERNKKEGKWKEKRK